MTRTAQHRLAVATGFNPWVIHREPELPSVSWWIAPMTRAQWTATAQHQLVRLTNSKEGLRSRVSHVEPIDGRGSF